MAATSVKDVGSVMSLQAAMGNLSAGAVNAAKNTGNSFQSVFDSQTGAGNADKPQTQQVKGNDRTAKPGEDLRSKEHTRKDVKPKEDRQAKDVQELSQEDLEKASEVVGTAVSDLIAQIADTFDIPVEEVEALMTDMNLEPADLLNPENLSNLLLEAGGAVDSMSLLTNEQLYGDYQMLMEQGRQLVDEVSEELNITPEQLEEAFAATPEAVPVTEQVDDRPVGVREDDEKKAVVDDGKHGQMTEQPLNAENPGEVQRRGEAQNGEQHTGAGRHAKSEPKADGTGNLVLQSIRDENFNYQMEDVQASAGAGETNTQDIMRQIMDYMRVQLKPDVTSMEMQLHPASLGTLQVQVEAKGGVLTASFVTQNEAVKAALESQMIQLQESFEQQGMKVEAIEVTVATHQFEQNLDQQGREGQQSGEAQEGRRQRVRRLDLGSLNDLIPEELEDEDRIAAEMMAANGGTVDYTA